ncbi:MAG: hypothetical protein WAM97_17895, partial [Acidimicrobiales bacterium]
MSDPIFEVDESTDEHIGAQAAVVQITSAARDVVLGARAAENDPEHLALWIEVTGVNGNAFTYDIYFQSVSDAHENDAVYADDELPIVVPEAGIEQLRGAKLDFSDEGDGGLVIVNPNTPPRRSSPSPLGDLSGDLAQRVLAVLEEQVNPAIAAHGGRADLMRMDGEIAVLSLSGGC